MATGNITVTTGAVFIPEIWQAEVRAFRRKKLVMANLVKNINFVGKKGDTLHIPDITEMAANDKAAGSDVTFQTYTETEFTMAIDKHKESSFKLEDITATQSAYDLRSEYTKGAGYALAKAVDSSILGLHTTSSFKYRIGSTGAAWSATSAGNGTDIAEAGLRQMIEELDSSDVPEDGRALVIHPSQKNVMLGIARFTEMQTYGTGDPIHTGQFGEIFGVPVYVTTQVPTLAAADTTTLYRVNWLFHRDAVILATQANPRVQAMNMVRSLATEVAVDEIYGVKVFRLDHAIGITTPV